MLQAKLALGTGPGPVGLIPRGCGAPSAHDYLLSQSARQLSINRVPVEKSRFTTRFFPLPVSWLFSSFVSSGQVHAVAICGVDLPLRNRTSRFRFCAVAAR